MLCPSCASANTSETGDSRITDGIIEYQCNLCGYVFAEEIDDENEDVPLFKFDGKLYPSDGESWSE